MESRDLKERLPKLEKFLLHQQGSVKVFEDSLLSGSVRDDRIDSFLYSIYSCHLHSVIAQYSLGQPISTIKESFQLTVEYFLNLKGSLSKPKVGSTYYDHLSVISLALLLDVNDDIWCSLVNKWSSFKMPDRLIDLIIQSRISDHKVANDCLYSKMFDQAVMVLEVNNIEESTTVLNQYVKKWYIKFRSGSWYDSHDRPNEIGYFGYWSFESAAIAKIKNLPLENTKLGQYFPYSFFSLPEQINKAPKQRARKGYQRVNAPDFERFSIEIPQDYRNVSEERLSIKSSDNFLALDLTIHNTSREGVVLFSERYHEQISKEFTWLSSVSELEEAKIGKFIGLRKSYLSDVNRDRDQTIFDHYIFRYKGYYLELQFRYVYIYAEKYNDKIHKIVKSVRVK